MEIYQIYLLVSSLPLSLLFLQPAGGDPDRCRRSEKTEFCLRVFSYWISWLIILWFVRRIVFVILCFFENKVIIL